jgi:uncharacterized protein with HEPN domain
LKDDRPYIDHILQAIAKVNKYTENLTREEFENNELIQDAVIRNIEKIQRYSFRYSLERYVRHER